MFTFFLLYLSLLKYAVCWFFIREASISLGVIMTYRNRVIDLTTKTCFTIIQMGKGECEGVIAEITEEISNELIIDE